MTRLLAITVTALAMGLAPAMATENSSPPTQPPTANTTSPEASKSATVPPSGTADTSGGAAELPNFRQEVAEKKLLSSLRASEALHRGRCVR